MAPGVVVHELAHHLICRICGVEVREVVYFRFGQPAGYVSHVVPPLFRQHLLIAAGPLLVNSAVTLSLLVTSVKLIRSSQETWWPLLAGLALWLAGAIGLQAWPSEGDAHNLWRASSSHLRSGNVFSTLGLLLAAAILLVERSRSLGSRWLYLAFLAYLSQRAGGGLV